jgi:heat-inducible transcriptional repressor
MIDDRKAAILRAVVEEYIATAQPVGSQHVLERAPVKVSSATVRNEMASLEREGFLQQPHTSAGRIPTEKAYRFFVDQLGQPGLSRPDVATVRSFFDAAHLRIERLLSDTTRLLSNLTTYTAVVVGPPHETAVVRSVQVVPLSGHAALAVVVFADGSIERVAIDLPADANDAHLAAATARLSTLFVGSTATAAPSPPPTGDPVVDELVDEVVGHLTSAPDLGEVYVGGTARMASAFEASETLRSVLAVLEEQFLVMSLLRDVVDRGLQVAIGTEVGVAPLAECSLVVAPYRVDGQAVGSIGVLGPTRMNYPQALAAVAVVSNHLSDRLSQD